MTEFIPNTLCDTWQGIGYQEITKRSDKEKKTKQTFELTDRDLTMK